MSGIAGVVRFDGAPIEPGLIEGMTAALSHRGPDGLSQWSDGPVGMGHCLLQTTPESLEETQPLLSSDGSLVLVMDGRVDNWEEVRAALMQKGAHLRTRSDAELVLHAYERWGRDCVRHIDGDFAVVIWDAHRRQLFCARDRMAARPLYYHWDGRRFAFASELHAILSLPWVNEALNEGMLAEILTPFEQLSRDETFWVGVLRLVAAHRMSVTSEGIKTDEYWVPELTKEIRYRHLDDYVAHYRELLFDSVRRMSRSHRPLACEVSGGLDSSAVFAVAEDLRRNGRLLAPGLDGYTLHFGDRSGADEIEFARAVGAHLGRGIKEVSPSLVPLGWYEDWAARYRDFPHYPNTVMSLSMHGAVRDAGSRATLTGYGGDEWLMGSRYYYADFLERWQPARIVHALLEDSKAFGVRSTLFLFAKYGLFGLLPVRFERSMKRLRRSVRRNAPTTRVMLRDDLEKVWRERRERHDAERSTATRGRHRNSLETLHLPSRAHTRESFNLLSASAGIETRDPLTSRAMVEFHFQTPEHIRIRSNEYRLCHRLAVRGMLPEQVRNRASKAEFSTTLRRHVDDFDEAGAFPLSPYASMWLRPDQWSSILLRSRQDSGGAALWSLWGLFGCALLANNDARLRRGAAHVVSA
jgi:asparagine synthase (glutamine-hydrolysing)